VSGLAVFNRYGLRALAGITDINAPVSARIIRHDEIDAHPCPALWARKTYQPSAEDRFYFRHTVRKIPGDQTDGSIYPAL
jgi:hypothetical protein